MPKRSYSNAFGGSSVATSGRTMYRARKTYRRRAIRGAKLSRYMPSTNIHAFRRYCTIQNVDVTGPFIDLSWTFTLADVINYTEFTALYDRFCLDKCLVKIKMVSNPNSVAYTNAAGGTTVAASLVNNTNIYPTIWFCPDYDNATTETIDQLKQRGRVQCKVLKPDEYLTMSVRPAVASAVYNGLTSGYGPRWSTWIDCDNATTAHYGMKASIDLAGFDPTNDYPYRFSIERLYYFRCKDVR